ncbi:MAG: tRNA guanosine(15) transglycosylase TgtA [Candidatus Lokiarchaeota archaeon]|nr:tRNA guanosine(15) transglycosylase TgtA [Candidatus Lokiarchaeota archaeon]
MKYELKKFDAGGRIGLISHNGKNLITPNLLPVVSPIDNLIPPKELFVDFGASALFTNAYILFRNKENSLRAQLKGLHSYLDYPGLIATDSGAFQHYMYGTSNEVTAEEIELFQEKVQSDFPVILDVPVQLNDSYEKAKDKIIQTLNRAKDNISRRRSPNSAWYGPIHGTLYPDLLQRCCEEMNGLDYDVYAVGGIVKAMNDYDFELCVDIFLTVNKYIRKDKPLHMFGLGLPQFFSLAVATGADLMDSAAYILFAKEGRYFTLEGTRNIADLTELPCSCPICSTYSAKEINSLFKSRKKLSTPQNNKGIELIAKHNLYISFGELKVIRESIRAGTLWELVEQRIQSHPKLIRGYEKIAKYWNELEKNIPLGRKKGLLLKGDVSFSRPIFYRMVNQVHHKYRIPKNSVLLLVPEYTETLFNTTDGRELISAIEGILVKSHQHIEPMVISSYFGVIPLDLYGVYPFSQREWVLPRQGHNISFDPVSSVLEYLKKNQDNYNYIIILYPKENEVPLSPENTKRSHFMEEIIDILENKREYFWGPKTSIVYIQDIQEILEIINN